jgi:hypothetical protein
MNAPTRKLALEDLLHKWCIANRNVEEIEQTIEELRDHLEDVANSLNIIENDIGRACESCEESMVYSIDDVIVVLAWQEDQNYHTIELTNVETI